jgi:hypothetical protein
MMAKRGSVAEQAYIERAKREQIPPYVRQPISLRLRPGLRDRIWAAAAKENKTSLNEMVNDLLERGLDADQRQTETYGSVAGAAVARTLISAVEAVVAKHGADQGLWLYDPENFDRATNAINQVLEILRPETQTALAEVEAARKRHLELVKHG